MATAGGLFHRGPDGDTLVPWPLPVSNGVTELLRDRQDTLWVGSHNEGLLRILPNGSIQHMRHRPDQPGSLSDNRILSLLQDRAGLLWVGTINGGVNLYRNSTITHYSHNDDEPQSLSHNSVWALCQDRPHRGPESAGSDHRSGRGLAPRPGRSQQPAQ